MAERILAVDHAASMVEEMLRQGHSLSSSSAPAPHAAFGSAGQLSQPLNACLFLGFEPDPSQNIAARIRGPNDQYINHIINETGASVVLRGLGSANPDIPFAEDAQQPLHLYLSSSNPKSFEAARSLAENLLDTISKECGVSRISSIKPYSAVPPQLSLNPAISSSCAISAITQASQSFTPGSISTALPSRVLIQNGITATCGATMPNTGTYTYPTATAGTCYSGYGGIYPQATPLQQVALALKQAPLSAISVVNSMPNTTSNSNADIERQPPPKRKFQELPVTSKAPTINQNSRQGSECFKPGLEDADTQKLSLMPLPKMPSQPSFLDLPPPPPPSPPQRAMPPPPPKFPSHHNHNAAAMMPPPPPKIPSDHNHNSTAMMPPPKFSSSHSPLESHNRNPEMRSAFAETSKIIENARVEPVSETVLKLVEYEEEDEDDMAASAEESSCRSNAMRSSSLKPFWAV